MSCCLVVSVWIVHVVYLFGLYKCYYLISVKFCEICFDRDLQEIAWIGLTNALILFLEIDHYSNCQEKF